MGLASSARTAGGRAGVVEQKCAYTCWGAGASVHAGYPLTAKLGEELVAWSERDEVEGANHRDGLRALRERFGSLDDLESILTELQKDLKGGRTIPDVAAAISWFFNSIRNQPAELYDQLAQGHVKPGDVVITFNYDLAVERSLRSAGLWAVFDGYGAAMEFAAPHVESSK